MYCCPHHHTTQVFGRGLPVALQALTMLAAFILIGFINMSFRPLRTFAMGLLEYMSTSVLAFTVILGLTFVSAPDLGTGSQVPSLVLD
jgi:hypothetical protein